MTYIYLYLFLGALVVLFPKDAMIFAQLCEQWVKLHYINAKCFVQAYFMWRKLKKDFGGLGFPIPPFKFIPIWKRDC